MVLSLVENGWDSLEYGIKYYEQFLSLEDKLAKNNPTYLKMAIIMIQNACELFLKSYLSGVNELLVYNFQDKQIKNELLSFYSRSLKETDRTLEFYLINEPNKIKTIDYNDAVKIFNSIYQLEYKHLWSIEKIGVYRNMVTHYGINIENEYHKVLQAINGTLDLIFEKIYKYIKTQKAIELYKKYDSLIVLAEDRLLSEWSSPLDVKFTEVNLYIETTLAEPKNLEFMKAKDISASWTKPKKGNHFNEIYITYNGTEKFIYVNQSPFLNVTFFADDLNGNGPIYFILDHSPVKPENELIIFKKEIYEFGFEYTDTKFWEKDSFRVDREYRKFTKENFNYALMNGINTIKKVNDTNYIE